MPGVFTRRRQRQTGLSSGAVSRPCGAVTKRNGFNAPMKTNRPSDGIKYSAAFSSAIQHVMSLNFDDG